MSVAVDILAAVKSALEGVSGLSAEKVIRGLPQDGATGPCAWVAAGDLQTGFVDLATYEQVILVDWWATPAVDSDTFGAREDACLALSSLCVDAIRASTTLQALCLTPVEVATRLRVGNDGHSQPLIVGVVSCKYESEGGL